MADGIPFECPQAAYNGGLPIPPYPQSEDCLFLNVYAPQNASSLPVLVWIHVSPTFRETTFSSH